jgi:hypothetical protein
MYISVLSYAPTLETLLKPRVFAPSLHVIDGVLVVSQPDASGLPRIPGAEREVELIRKIFSDSTDILYRSQSIVAAVPRAMKCHSWVHLAYHEIQHPRGPTKSAFLLHDDGLTLSMLTSKSLHHAELVIPDGNKRRSFPRGSGAPRCQHVKCWLPKCCQHDHVVDRRSAGYNRRGTLSIGNMHADRFL